MVLAQGIRNTRPLARRGVHRLGYWQISWCVSEFQLDTGVSYIQCHALWLAKGAMARN